MDRSKLNHQAGLHDRVGRQLIMESIRAAAITMVVIISGRLSLYRASCLPGQPSIGPELGDELGSSYTRLQDGAV